jgi:hypothetical protein
MGMELKVYMYQLRSSCTRPGSLNCIEKDGLLHVFILVQVSKGKVMQVLTKRLMQVPKNPFCNAFSTSFGVDV